MLHHTRLARSTKAVCLALLALGIGGSLATRARAADAAADFARLLDDHWTWQLRDDPLFATSYGEHAYDDRLPDESLAAHEHRQQQLAAYLARWQGLDRAALSDTDQVNYDLFGWQLRESLAEYGFGAHLMPITNRSGFHIYFPELPKRVPLRTVRDYDHYVARLQAFPAYVDQHIELMREGVRRKLVLPAVVLEDYQRPLEANIVDDVRQSPLFEAVVDFPESLSPADRERLTGAISAAIKNSIVPGYRAFEKFLRDEYVPAARGEIGASALPDGRAFYRHRVKRFTTLDLTPEEVHATGQAEVRRIRTEMDTAIKASGFAGDFAAFVEFLRTDPRFYVDTPEALLKEVSFVLKRMDGQLPKLFGRLPRMPYGVREVPAYIAPRTTTAYYTGPAGDGTDAGYFYVNTSNLKSRPLFEIEALSLHEAVPGHHLQIALQQELDNQPPFRRFASFTAFIEGWGLYAERLGLECGFYKDPYSNFGRLSYEAWRACRLVVDSGMHYLGWSRQQAIDFMIANTALTQHNVEAEVDRYIAWPGQALAYKTGELHFRQLRRESEERLGERFDIRAFHDVVLASGAVPLPVVERNVHAWLDQVERKD
ncbi:MAG: DUF885 domain-containing protein [Pirellulales bacterium]|nr:DUF885 domain-containing protein [Pirellulales bacterium]